MSIDNFEKIDKALAKDDIQKYQAYFDNDVMSSRQLQDGLWKVWHGQMKSFSYQDDYDMKHTFSKWYTMLTWKRINNLSIADFLGVAIDRQIVQALRGMIDVWDAILWYLKDNGADKSEMEVLYEEIQKRILNSEIILYKGDAEIYKMNDLVQDVKQADTGSDSSMESAELYVRLRKKIFSDFTDEQLTQTTEFRDDVVLRRLVDLINFCVGVDIDNIWYVVDTYTDPMKYKILEESKNAVGSVDQNDKSDQLPQQSHYHEAKEELEVMYRYDSQGELQPIEEVLGKLSEFAQKYNDPQIEELYYFDEGQEKFVWNQDLLKE